jgi:CelD/BcsL family acetyltransferase involved in cellulose biosynthesis
MLTLEVADSLESLESLQADWNELLERCSDATIFQTWEWAYSWRRHFDQDARPMVLAVRDSGKLIGLAPLEIVIMTGGFRCLRLMATDSSDYMNFLLDDQMADQTLSIIADWLETHLQLWDVMDLHQIPESSLLLRPGVFGGNGRLVARKLAQETCHFISLPSTWDSFLATLGTNTRRDVRANERAIFKNFESVEVRQAEGPLIDEFMNAFFTLHSKRWEDRGEAGLVADQRMRDFCLEVSHRTAKEGRLALFGLRLNDEIEAVWFGFSLRDKAYPYLGGFNSEPEFRKFSLGATLMAFAVRNAIEAGFAEYDLLRGEETYKARWNAQLRRCYRLIVRHDGARSCVASWSLLIQRSIGHRTRSIVYKALSLFR